MSEPKMWTPPPGGQQATATAKPPPSLPTIAVGALVVLAGLMLIFSGVQQIRGGLGQTSALSVSSFDPAKPQALGDPTPQIDAHLQKLAGAEIVPTAIQSEMRDFIRGIEGTLPGKLDEMTTVVAVRSVGRHVALDNRVMLNQPVPDLAAFRKRLREGMEPSLKAKFCLPANVTVVKFLRDNDITLTHAYTLNDGNPTIFIDLQPNTCDQPAPT